MYAWAEWAVYHYVSLVPKVANYAHRSTEPAFCRQRTTPWEEERSWPLERERESERESCVKYNLTGSYSRGSSIFAQNRGRIHLPTSSSSFCCRSFRVRGKVGQSLHSLSICFWAWNQCLPLVLSTDAKVLEWETHNKVEIFSSAQTGRVFAEWGSPSRLSGSCHSWWQLYLRRKTHGGPNRTKKFRREHPPWRLFLTWPARCMTIWFKSSMEHRRFWRRPSADPRDHCTTSL